jgi:transposase-like protein
MGLPNWVPQGAQHYLTHTEMGLSIRAVARDAGCAASTVLRQVRRFENRRDDPLVDEALRRLGARRPALSTPKTTSEPMEGTLMSAPIRSTTLTTEDLTLEREAKRILRRLAETGAVLAVSNEMEKAVVVRSLPGGQSARTGVVDRTVAQAMALKDWIACTKTGKVAQYEITGAGRAALKRMLAKDSGGHPAQFGDQHRVWGEKTMTEAGEERPTRYRYNLAESPLAAVARRKDKNGQNFLSDDLVSAGERLREDFEMAQMGPRVGQNWDRFLTGGDRGAFAGDSGLAMGPAAARERVSKALRDLGPGLGDVVLRCCCFLEGMEAAERRMGWSARSGKIVLRIALQRLRRHYDETEGKYGAMIG